MAEITVEEGDTTQQEELEVDGVLDRMVDEVLEVDDDSPGGLDWPAISDPGTMEAHLAAIHDLNAALNKMDSDGDCCVVRGVDSGGELYPLSAPLRAGDRPRIVPGGRARLLLYNAMATSTVWDGKRIGQAPVATLEELTACLSKTPKQRRRAGAAGGVTRTTVNVRVLIDSGASRDFVSAKLVKEKQLRTFPAKSPLRVTLADGAQCTAERMVHLTLDFQGFTYSRAMYVLPLGVSAAVVLGTPFLEDISPFSCDLRQDARTITFRRNGKTIRLTPAPEGMPGGNPVLDLRKAMLHMRTRRRLLKSEGSDEALAYLCVLMPSKEQPAKENAINQEEAERAPTHDSRASEGIQAGVNQEAMARLRQGPHNAMPAEQARAVPPVIGKCLQQLREWDGKGALPEAAGVLIQELRTLVKERSSLGEEFWDAETRKLLEQLIQCEFHGIIKEELPIREGPDIDFTKVPAVIRFKDTYAGETPSRPGIRMSPVELQQCREILLDLLAKGYIRPSASPFGAPILMVPKPGQPGKLRMVVDYRALNALTQADRYPLPTIDCLLQQMSGSRVFSTIDMLNGFWQMPLLEEHRERTAMTTTMFGSFEWNVLPMGLKNSPAIFQRNMAELLRDLDYVSVYIDDVIIHSRTVEEHVQHVRTVMQRLRRAQICVKGSKASLFRKSVNFLGHLVGGDGVAPQDKKVEAVANWPTPKNVSEVRSFLGLASFYRKFIHHFASIAAPLHALTKADVEFQWGDEQSKAFDMLKAALTSAPLLILPDVNKALSGEAPYLVQCDASLLAWGAVLMQDVGKGYQPIAFASKSFNAAQVNYSATERELQALVSCTCEEWRHYLFGMDYQLQGDHRPLVWLMDPRRELSRRQARWITQLMENNVPAMTWVPGKQLVVPDAISRRPDLMEVAAEPQDGIRLETGGLVVRIRHGDDPEGSVQPVNPLREGYSLPSDLQRAPKASTLRVDEGIPSRASEGPQSEKLPAERAAGAVSGTTPLEPAASATGSRQLGAMEVAATLSEARMLWEDGAGFQDILAICLTRTSDTATGEQRPRQQQHQQQQSQHWLPVRAQVCLPVKGPGSVDHAFDTLAWMAGGVRWEDEERYGGQYARRESYVPPRPLWEALGALEVALVADNVGQWGPEREPSWALLQRDQTDWTFEPSEFRRLQEQYGPYDVDACCDIQGRNRQQVTGGAYWHDCLSQPWEGLRLWVNPPFDARLCHDLLEKVKRARETHPETAATFILPEYLTRGTLRHKLKQIPGMERVQTYPSGTRLFYTADGALLPSRWPTEVWNVAPGEFLAGVSDSEVGCRACGKPSSKRQGRVQQCLQCGACHHRNCLPARHTGRACPECEHSVWPSKKLSTDSQPVRDVDALSTPHQVTLLEQVKRAAQGDKEYQQWSSAADPAVFRQMGGLLWRVEGGGLQLVLPDDLELKDVVLQECHSSAAAGHLGVAKTFERVTRRFWWKGVRADVSDFVGHCDSCQRNKHRRRDAPQGTLHTVKLPSRRFEIISIDFVTGLPKTERGYNCILTITDKFSRLVRLVPMLSGETESSAEEVARLFVDNWWRQFGVPAKIISDRDTRFTSKFWSEFVRLVGSRAAMTTSFHPQANGQAENTNQTMETVLRAYVDPRQEDWDRHLAAVEFCINDSVHAATGYSPFQLVYGESPLSHLDLFLLSAKQEEELGDTPSQRVQLDAAARFMEKWRRNLSDARLKMEKAQLLQKHYFDARRKEVEFQLGDRLLVSKKHMTLPADRDLPWKLRSLWEGPYTVTRVLKDDGDKAFAYKLDLPVHVKRTGLHDVFSADRVVKYRGESRWPSQQENVPETVMVEGQREHFVEKILRHRDVKPPGRVRRGEVKRPRREYLVKWEGLPLGEAQWRTVEKLNRGGILGAWRTYERDLGNKDPQLMSEEARQLLVTGGFDTDDEEEKAATNSTTTTPRTPSPTRGKRDEDQQEEVTATRRSARLRRSADTQARAEQAVLQYLGETRLINATPRALVLFSGSGSVERALRVQFPRIQVMSLDIDPRSAATEVQDIRQFVQTDLLEFQPGYFDLVWASPPCTEYSRAKTRGTRDLDTADQVVASTLACLLHLRPRYWFVENPNGLLRSRPLMRPLEPYLHLVSYCHYGTLYRKDTCIWSNVPDLDLQKCRTATPCSSKRTMGFHTRTAQSGPSRNVPGSGIGKKVYAIPAALLQQMFQKLPL